MGQGAFRDDLFYRINTLILNIPPLRDRLEDIHLIAEMCIRKHAATSPARRLGANTLRELQQRPWRGNVRELVHVLERAMILCEGDEITPELLTADIVPITRSMTEVPVSSPNHFQLNEVEHETIKKALIVTDITKDEPPRLLEYPAQLFGGKCVS